MVAASGLRQHRPWLRYAACGPPTPTTNDASYLSHLAFNNQGAPVVTVPSLVNMAVSLTCYAGVFQRSRRDAIDSLLAFRKHHIHQAYNNCHIDDRPQG